MVKMLDYILKYWVAWVCGLVAAGIVAFFKRFWKLQKKALRDDLDKEAESLKKEVVEQFEDELHRCKAEIEAENKKQSADIEAISLQVESLEIGILSIQGKQFRETCLALLEPDHMITVLEYEQFEEDYNAYKALGGNHRGDALHDRVVDKFDKQLK